jgi:pimeloyl-ACP methyl ester carboxylesterase
LTICKFLGLLYVLGLTGCALVQSPAERAASLAQSTGFSQLEGDPGIRTYYRRQPDKGSAQALVVYIEGDGAPWQDLSHPPTDPTPVDLTVLGMAAADPASHVAYLGRACQYLGAADLARCESAAWTHGRFSAPLVAKMTDAVDRLKTLTGATRVALVGHSGGGTMAALLAARRSDVSCLVTVAAPLDTAGWTRTMKVSPLRTSLNPADDAHRLKGLPQTHFIGGRDVVVPYHWAAQTLQLHYPFAHRIDRADDSHTCCWRDAWAALRAQSCLDGV